jgi:LacI family transcriptional regulator
VDNFFDLPFIIAPINVLIWFYRLYSLFYIKRATPYFYMRTTIKDIARELGINPSTVSRALHNHPDVSAETKAAIKKLAAKMDYRPNQMAINLRSGHSKTIGLIIPEISMFFFPSVIKAIEEETHQRGYNLLVLHSNDSAQREIENAEICAFNGVAGVLASLTRESFDIEHFSDLEFAGMPVVYFDKVLQDTVAHKIEIPSEMAAKKAVVELLNIKKDAQRVCGIFGDVRLHMTQGRVEGFRKGLREQNSPFRLDNIVFADSMEEARKATLELFAQQVKPDAIFAMTDEVLAGILQAIGKLQLHIPNDLAIVAISDGYLPNLSAPPLPYVETSGYKTGRTAIQLLFDLIDGKHIIPQSSFIDTPFIKND